MRYKLSDICEYAKGKIDIESLNQKTYISTENMLPDKGGVTKASSLPTVAQTQLFLEGDVLVSNIRPYFKKIWFATFNGGCSNDVLVFRAKEGVSKRFLHYVLANDSFFEYTTSTAKGTKMPRGDKVAIMQYEIPMFSFENQEKIAGILEVLDKKIHTNIEINENLLQQLSEIYRSWYIDFSTVSEDFISSEYGDIPIGWHYKQLGDVCQSISVTHKFDKDQLIFLNTGDIDNGQFLHSSYMPVKDMPGQAKKTICPDDILYSEIRPANKHFAYVNFPSEDYVVSTKLMVIRSKGIDSRRLYHFLTMKETLTELQLQAESRSGTFPQIRFDNVSKLPILIADAATENTFTGILHSVYRQIESNIAENDKLAQIRDSLLPKLMTGELDVSNLDL